MANEKIPEKQTSVVADVVKTSNKKGGRNKKGGNRPQIGGTAVVGAKSTLPKQVPQTNNPSQQQAESYNRTMRRRMEQLGTGEEDRTQTLQEKRQKRIDRKKQKLEQRREELRRSLPGGKVKLDRRNTYFLIAVAVLVVLLIAVFIVLRLLHVL